MNQANTSKKGGEETMTVFKHRKDDVAITVRFRHDVWDYLESKMHNRRYIPDKKMFGAANHLPTKSIHKVLDWELRKLMKQ